MKNEFRKICLNQKIHNRLYYSKIINKRLYKIAKNYKKILLFIPLKNEVDLFWLIKKLKRENKNIFVPFMQDLSFKMVKYQLPLKKKKFSILEPINKQKTLQKIDLAIVPVVGIDKKCKRIGFGKGMYDRFFEMLNYRPKIVFTQLKLCYCADEISDKYDITCDEYISFHVNKRRKNGLVNSISCYDCIASRGICYSKKVRCGKI